MDDTWLWMNQILSNKKVQCLQEKNNINASLISMKILFCFQMDYEATLIILYILELCIITATNMVFVKLNLPKYMLFGINTHKI